MTLPTFTLKGSALDLLSVTSPTRLQSITLTPNTRGQVLAISGTVYRPEPVTVVLDSNGAINGSTGVALLANDASLNLATELQYKVTLVAAAGFPRPPREFWFTAPAAGTIAYLGNLSATPPTSPTGYTRGPIGVDDVRVDGDYLQFYLNNDPVGDPIPLLVSAVDGGTPSTTSQGSIDGGTL